MVFTTYGNIELCVLSHLVKYLEITAGMREQNSQLLLSITKPYQPVSRDTISRWIKIVLHESGIDTDQFTAHSVRSASTSKLARNGIALDIILNAANWVNASTFATFYNKQIQSCDASFQQAVVTLNSANGLP